MNTLVEKLDISGWGGLVIGVACIFAMATVMHFGNRDETIIVFAAVLVVHAFMVNALRSELRKLKGQL